MILLEVIDDHSLRVTRGFMVLDFINQDNEGNQTYDINTLLVSSLIYEINLDYY